MVVELSRGRGRPTATCTHARCAGACAEACAETRMPDGEDAWQTATAGAKRPGEERVQASAVEGHRRMI